MSETPAEAVAQDAGNQVEVSGEPTGVYRFYDHAGALLYVGISCNLVSRWNTHRTEKHWWPLVVRKTVAMYGSREEAEAAELTAIRTESPIHNVAGREPTKPKRLRITPKTVEAQRQTELDRLRHQPMSFTPDPEFQGLIDAFAIPHNMTRVGAAGYLLLTGLYQLKIEADWPLEQQMAAIKARWPSEESQDVA